MNSETNYKPHCILSVAPVPFVVLPFSASTMNAKRRDIKQLRKLRQTHSYEYHSVLTVTHTATHNCERKDPIGFSLAYLCLKNLKKSDSILELKILKVSIVPEQFLHKAYLWKVSSWKVPSEHSTHRSPDMNCP